MAERRMFSKRLINSARFIKMPASTRCLYFHLGLYADDDGVVEAFNVMNLIGATNDDLKLLVAKGFVIVLNEDLVTYITDWKENNKVRADRKIDSIYKDLLIQKVPDADLIKQKKQDDVKKTTGQPSDNQVTTKCQPSVNQVTTKCQPSDNQLTTNCQPSDNQHASNSQKVDRIGKDRLGKDSIDNTPPLPPSEGEPVKKRFKPPTKDEVQDYCDERSNNVDAEAFVDFYQAKNWYIGKNKMKDWKAAVRTWEKRRNVKRRSKEPEIPDDLKEAFDMC